MIDITTESTTDKGALCVAPVKPLPESGLLIIDDPEGHETSPYVKAEVEAWYQTVPQPVSVDRTVLVSRPGEPPNQPVPMSELCAHPRDARCLDRFSGEEWCRTCGKIFKAGRE